MERITAAVVALLLSGGLAYAEMGKKLSQAECQSLWGQANPANAATITEADAALYISDVKAANPDGDGILDQKEFQAACSKGLVKSSASSGASTGDSMSKEK
jgi:hypothetical protein